MTRDEILEMMLALGEMGSACSEVAAYLEKGAKDPSRIDDSQVAAAVRDFTVGCEMLSKLAGGAAATAPTIPAPPPVLIDVDPVRDMRRLEASLADMVPA